MSGTPVLARVGLMSYPAGAGERRFACGVGLLSLLVLVALVPFARIPLAPFWLFIPAYESTLVISDLFTAGLLIRQFSENGHRAVLILAAGYFFTALIVIAHALSFPDLFAPTGLLGAGPQTTAWLYMFWHGGFPFVVIAFALLKDDGDRLVKSRGRAGMAAGIVTLLAVIAFTALTTAGQDILPSIMDGNRYTPVMKFVVGTTWALSALALYVLWRRRSGSVLDLWLMVVMCAWICDIGLSAVFNGGRYDLGFYAGRIFGLLASGLVLIVLLEPRFTVRHQSARP